MKHATREIIEASTKLAEDRLKKANGLRDVIHVLAVHAGKCGQEELSDQLHGFLIGYTDPVNEEVLANAVRNMPRPAITGLEAAQ